MAEKPKIIDAEFEIAERRMPIRWVSIFRWVFWTAAMSFGVYNLDTPWERAALVFGSMCCFAIAPLFALLTKPTLQQEEVEALAERMRANARPGRGRR